VSRHVTEVLDYLTEPELLSWMLRTSKAKRDAVSKESLEIGTVVDRMIQEDLFPSASSEAPPSPLPLSPLSPTPPPPPLAGAWGAGERGKGGRPDIISGVKGIQLELEHGGIVGHPDIFYEDDTRWGIIDVKTSRTMYPRYWTQTAEYTELKRLLDYKYVDKPRFIAILRLDKESGLPFYMEITDESQIAYEVGIFNAYRMAYDHLGERIGMLCPYAVIGNDNRKLRCLIAVGHIS